MPTRTALLTLLVGPDLYDDFGFSHIANDTFGNPSIRVLHRIPLTYAVLALWVLYEERAPCLARLDHPTSRVAPGLAFGLAVYPLIQMPQTLRNGQEAAASARRLPASPVRGPTAESACNPRQMRTS